MFLLYSNQTLKDIYLKDYKYMMSQISSPWIIEAKWVIIVDNDYLIFVLILFIINISHMPEVVEVAQKSKKIAKAQPGRQVRLWVRAKFLSFRRYYSINSEPNLSKTPTKPFSDLKESMIVDLLNTTLARE